MMNVRLRCIGLVAAGKALWNKELGDPKKLPWSAGLCHGRQSTPCYVFCASRFRALCSV